MDKVKEALVYLYGSISWPSMETVQARQTIEAEVASLEARVAAAEAAEADTARLDYIERTYSGMTNRERYLPVQMIWGKGSNGRTLREACDKYMKRDAALAQGADHAG